MNSNIEYRILNGEVEIAASLRSFAMTDVGPFSFVCMPLGLRCSQ